MFGAGGTENVGGPYAPTCLALGTTFGELGVDMALTPTGRG